MNNELNTNNETPQVTPEVNVQPTVEQVQPTPVMQSTPAPQQVETAYVNSAIAPKKTIFSPVVIVAIIALVAYAVYFFLNM